MQEGVKAEEEELRGRDARAVDCNLEGPCLHCYSCGGDSDVWNVERVMVAQPIVDAYAAKSA